MAPAEAEIRRSSRAASPAPRKSAAAAGDENERRGAAGNAQPTEDVQKSTPIKPQTVPKKEEPAKDAAAAVAKPAPGNRRRVLLAATALIGVTLVTSLAWIYGAGLDLSALGDAAAEAAGAARGLVEKALAGATSALGGAPQAAAAAAAALGAIGFTVAVVVVRRRRTAAAGEAKEKDA